MKKTAYNIARMLIMLIPMSASTLPAAWAVDHLESLSIEAPNKIGSLIVGQSNYAEVVALLGMPEFTENIKENLTKQDIMELRYPLKGIEFTIDKNKQMRVVRIEIYRPFEGSSVDGLRIGMPVAEAKRIISSRFGKPNIELDGYVDWEIPNTLALKYEDGIVIAIKMLGTLNPTNSDHKQF